MPRTAKLSDDPDARRLALTRLALGYATQKAFAKAAGIEENTYNPFETGKRPLNYLAARLICRRIPGPTTEWLLEGNPDRLPGWLVLKLIEFGALSPPASDDRGRGGGARSRP